MINENEKERSELINGYNSIQKRFCGTNRWRCVCGRKLIWLLMKDVIKMDFGSERR
jgi:hypothetical protein